MCQRILCLKKMERNGMGQRIVSDWVSLRLIRFGLVRFGLVSFYSVNFGVFGLIWAYSVKFGLIRFGLVLFG